MGDYQDLASCSEREALSNPRIHDSTRATLDEIYKEHCDAFLADIGFMKGKLIGLLEGNHYPLFSHGITGTQYMCQQLKCKYLGVCTYVRIYFTVNGARMTYDVFAHHGLGAARLLGGSLNRVQQMAEGAEADALIMGHDHKRVAGHINRLCLHGNTKRLEVRNRKISILRSGSFLRGYVDGQISYVADRCLAPTDLGWPRLKLIAKDKMEDKQRYRFIDSEITV